MLANAIDACDKIFFLGQCISKLETWVILFQKSPKKLQLANPHNIECMYKTMKYYSIKIFTEVLQWHI